MRITVRLVCTPKTLPHQREAFLDNKTRLAQYQPGYYVVRIA